MKLCPLTDEQIKKDNPHFGPKVRIVEPIKPYESKNFDFKFSQTVGAYDSRFECEPDDFFDAWATYLWSPSKNIWVLGAN